MTEDRLKGLRKEVADTTAEIMRLVARRNDLAKRIGEIKSSESLPVDDARTENELLSLVVRESKKNGMDIQTGVKVLTLLIAEAKRVQRRGPDAVETPTAIMAMAKELERQGRKLVRLDVGETDFAPPRAAVEAAESAMRAKKTHYTGARGIPELVSAMRSFLMKKYGFRAGEEQLVAVPGGRFAIYAALASLMERGGSCVVVDPSWPAYKQILEQLGARTIAIKTTFEEGWEPPVQKIAESIREDTRAMILNYPSNPTGKVVSEKTFGALVKVARDAGITLISDEIYDTYSRVGVPTILHHDLDDWLYVGSFSKSWAMTGFRLGFSVGSASLIGKMVNFQALSFTSLPEFLQHSAIAALGCDAEVRKNAEEMQERMDRACEALDRVPRLRYHRPDGGIYVFPGVAADVPEPSKFAGRLLREKGVTVVPGNSFGDYPEFFRVSLGGPTESILEGVRLMGELLS